MAGGRADTPDPIQRAAVSETVCAARRWPRPADGPGLRQIPDRLALGAVKTRVLDGVPTRHYKILGTSNIAGPSDRSNWQTVAQDIAVNNGVASAKFDVTGTVQYAFLRVAPMQ